MNNARAVQPVSWPLMRLMTVCMARLSSIWEGLFTEGYTNRAPHGGWAGFRGDVLDHVRALNTPIVRYPGATLSLATAGEDGVGPLNARPSRLDLTWKSLEPNAFGTDEFVRWCRKAGTEPMMAINLGTRGVDAARSLVDICNHPSGTQYSDWRVENSCAEPHNIKVWCLGNEMDGDWQIGHKTAL